MRDIENFRLVDGAKIDNLPNNTIQDIQDVENNLINHESDTTNPHSVTKEQIGLGNVDNTSDINKPISTATQTALDSKQATLVSGTNIKTVQGQSILGSGDLAVTPVIADDSITEAKLSTSVNTSLDKADSALQSSDIGTTVQAHSVILDGTTASFTTAKDTKLSGIEAGAEVNTINDVIAGVNIVIDKTDPLNPIFHSTGGGTGGGGISDGDKGDITVSSFGTVWTIDNQAVTRSKMEHIQTGHFLGRHATGTGDVQEVSPAQARTILDIDNLLASKADITGETFTGKINLPPSTASEAPLNLGIGVNPTTPLPGDIWSTSTTLNFRDGSGITRSLGQSGNLIAVTQANAEAGTETASRMWSALRVRQAITGWWATTMNTAWTSYTPAVSFGTSTGISVIFARYKQIGKTCVGGFQINIASPDTSIDFGTISLPIVGPYNISSGSLSMYEGSNYINCTSNIDGTVFSGIKISGNFSGGFLVIRGSFTYETN